LILSFIKILISKVALGLIKKILSCNQLSFLHLVVIRGSILFHHYVDSCVVNRLEIITHLDNLGITYCKLQLTGTGVLQIYSENRVYMVGCGKHSINSLNENYNNYMLLQHSSLKDLVDYELLKGDFDGGVYYSMERLNFITDKLPSLQHIIKLLSKKSEMHKLNLKKYDDIAVKLNLLPLLEVLKKKDFNLSYGLTHGDLTPDNIMQKNDGKIVLIDLDRLETFNFQFIDELHFYVEYYSSLEDQNWFSILESYLNGHRSDIWDDYLLAVYFLYRLDCELRGSEPTLNYSRYIHNFALVLLDHFSKKD